MPEDDTKAMTVRLSREQAEQLEAVAQVDEQTIADAVRQAITTHIDSRRKDAAFQRKLRVSLERNRRILVKLGRR